MTHEEDDRRKTLKSPESNHNPTSLDSKVPEDDDGELEELERELEGMARRITRFRRTIPGELSMTFSSLLASRRPEIPHIDEAPPSRPTVDGDVLSEAREGETSKGSLLAEEDPETAEKIDTLKSKISSNAAAIPVIIKRMNDCISAINKRDRYNGNVHPDFKRKRTY
ncbi:hypothetical protein QJS10_CPA09g01693 [Acorus calamus]|uniref:Uncharacterized protein n=1 Tax=Acorus calamus TaxID=4465 RepID=A0AAV9E6G2_ACOCL|nr:hypothetical protein QJS10_CPA09g01693 [Acorus calamus]